MKIARALGASSCAIALALIAPACGQFGSDTSEPAEAGAESGSGGASFCATQPKATICSDFDEGPGFGPWKVELLGSGALSTDTSRSTSAPSAMVSTIGGGNDDTARLTVAIAPTTKRVVLSFDVMLGTFELSDTSPTGAGNQSVSVAEIFCGHAVPGPYDGVWIFVEGATQKTTAVHAAGMTEDKIAKLSTTAWTHVVLDANIAAGSAVVTTGAPGAVGSTMTVFAFPANCGSNTHPIFEARAGLSTSSAAKASAFYDNIVYEVDPP